MFNIIPVSLITYKNEAFFTADDYGDWIPIIGPLFLLFFATFPAGIIALLTHLAFKIELVTAIAATLTCVTWNLYLVFSRGMIVGIIYIPIPIIALVYFFTYVF